MSDRVKPSFVIFTLTPSPERQSARISKITNEGLTRSGTGCFIAVPNTHMATVAVKGLSRVKRNSADTMTLTYVLGRTVLNLPVSTLRL